MRSATVLLVASTLTLATVAVIACSSDSTPAATTEDSGASSSGSSGSTSGDPDPGTSSSSGTSGASSGTSGASSGTSGSTSGDGGGSSSGSTYDGGGKVDGGDAGVLCLGGSIQETESNNTVGEADTLPNMTTSFCGHLEPGDVDYATFTWEVGKNSSRWDTAFSASAITVEITADGMAANFSTPPKPGKVYVVKITAAAATDYRLEVQMLP